ncbi:MAG: 50S ribosomal protein L1 [Deltaproteobacteria bacterium]
MSTHGKKYRALKTQIDTTSKYSIPQAVDLVLACQRCKFVESVDAALVLGVDPRKADQNIRGSVVLPHGTGKTPRVLVFAKAEKQKEAEEAGADYVGAEDLIEKIQGGWLDFDKVIATPDIMGLVGRVAKILGPRGLMPNAKTGSVTFDVSKAVRDLKGGKVDFRVDKAGVIHAPIGRTSFEKEKIEENLVSLVEALVRLKPASAKGTYIRSVTLSTTMGPGIKIDPAAVKTLGS